MKVSVETSEGQLLYKGKNHIHCSTHFVSVLLASGLWTM